VTDLPASAEPADAEPHDEPRDEDLAEVDLTNGQLARIFHDIGDMLEIKGELVFKTVAYHRAADAIARSPVDPACAVGPVCAVAGWTISTTSRGSRPLTGSRPAPIGSPTIA